MSMSRKARRKLAQKRRNEYTRLMLSSFKEPVSKLLMPLIIAGDDVTRASNVIARVLLPLYEQLADMMDPKPHKEVLINQFVAAISTLYVYDTGEKAFVEQIEQSPNDPTVRMIYADWLQDQDQVELAEFWRKPTLVM